MVSFTFEEPHKEQANACNQAEDSCESSCTQSDVRKVASNRIPILIDRILKPGGEERCSRQFKIPGDLTVVQFDVLVVTCQCGSQSIKPVTNSERRVRVKSEEENLSRSNHEWALDSNWIKADSGSWEAYPNSIDNAGMIELTRIVSEKEMKARTKFRKLMDKRAAGPRECSEAPSNLALAQAMAKCKLDTMVSGMIEVAVKKSTSPNAAPLSVGLCGSPGVVRFPVLSVPVLSVRT
jgi:hypothetical protein